MRWNYTVVVLALASVNGGALMAAQDEQKREGANLSHVHLIATSAQDGAQWYVKNMGCEARPATAERPDLAGMRCGSTSFTFITADPTGPSEGTGLDHIAFSVADVPAKVKALESAGVKVTMAGRDAPDVFRSAFVEDPWGTRIELVQDAERPGVHHIHLASVDPEGTLSWYENVVGGRRSMLHGQLDALLLCCAGNVWLLASQATMPLVSTVGRAITHLGFSFASDLRGSDLEVMAREMRGKGFPVTFTLGPRPYGTGMQSHILGPDGVDLDVSGRCPGNPRTPSTPWPPNLARDGCQ